MDKYEALKRYFGHDSFRPRQEEIIDALVAGRDVLAIMPTGSGKSVCYQIPAMLRPGMTIVISPLVALMRDQVEALRALGIPSAYINGTLTPGQMDVALARAAKGEFKVLYVAPERLLNPEFQRFISAAQANPRAHIGAVIVDEAHCISLWGSAFRPSYQRIDEFVASLAERPAIGAFTATATAAVARDIEQLLGLRAPLKVVTGFDRPNLYFDVRSPEDKLSELLALLSKRRGQCGVVYCLTRTAVNEVSEVLLQRGLSVARYHAGLSREERERSQQDFISGNVDIIVATNAFGMGIDKPDVRFVIHYNMPMSLEGYYQEAGRAGRDGEKADCVLMFSEKDIKACKWLIEHSAAGSELTPEQVAQLKQRELAKLDSMVAYCRTHDCLRHAILSYFGQDSAQECDWCSNCIRYSLLRKLNKGALSRLVRRARSREDGPSRP